MESPQGNAVVAEIVQEVKLALSAALDNRVSGKDSSSATTEGWSALFLRLEEDTLSALRARLDCSDFIAQKTKASCPSSEDLQMDSEVKETSGLAVPSDEERSTPQPEDGVDEPETSSKEEEVTTACTNEVISQMYDAYQLAELEEQRLRAARERESEVSLLTDHFVDSVMIQLKELASPGKTSAFQWIPKDVLLPAIRASHAADQDVFSPQFQIIAQQKVQEVLYWPLTGEAPSGHAPSAATDIVGALVRGMSNLSHSVGTFNSAEGDNDTSGSAQHIYNSVQDKVKVYLWGTKPHQQDSDSQLVESSNAYDTESSGETSEDDFNLASSEDGASPQPSQTSPFLEKKHSNNVARSRSPQPSQTSPFLEPQSSPASSPMRHLLDTPSWRTVVNRVRKLLCCSSPSETVTQTKDEDTSSVAEAGTSALHNLSEAHVSDIIVIMDREDTFFQYKQSGSQDSNVDSLPNTPETF